MNDKIRITLTELNRIKDVAEKLKVETFDIETVNNGIGYTLTFSYQTFVEDWPATVTVNLTDTFNW